MTPFERRIEQDLVEMLSSRALESSLCPSEVARAIDGDRWRQLMEPVRRAGRRLAAAGIVEFTQNGQVIDAATARGPIRIRRGEEFSRATAKGE